MFPYVLVSDVHCHNWSQFAKVGEDGVNTRLRIILDELKRAAETVLAAGGDSMRVAGDLFHVRGKIEPSVFNPTYDTFREITEMGVHVEIIPGNHDLEGANAERLGNAMQQLEQIDGVQVAVEPLNDNAVCMLPWIEDLDELREIAKKFADGRDLIIHAPLNGVIKGIPDLGLDPDEVAAWGFKRVFIGHYHNHKQFNGGVYSVGATTHQTWSDPGTKAGFLMVYEDRVEHIDSEAPKFINIDKMSELNPHNIGKVAGNYVRLRFVDAEESDVKAAKVKLENGNAAGWVDHSSKKRPTIRANGASGKNLTVEASVANFAESHLQGHDTLDKSRIAKDALDVLSLARQVGDE